MPPPTLKNCPKCNKTFTNKAAFSRHKMNCLKERVFNCTICSKDFARRDSLDRHRKTSRLCKKQSKKDECLKCNYCQKGPFRDKYNKLRHEAKHPEKRAISFGGANVQNGDSSSTSLSLSDEDTEPPAPVADRVMRTDADHAATDIMVEDDSRDILGEGIVELSGAGESAARISSTTDVISGGIVDPDVVLTILKTLLESVIHQQPQQTYKS